ncbi:MAG TPA: hypothetical protein VMR21_03425 [Vicinamibacteria bacterium]|nr:hypothetical protein [Vicinamibacteria bacterium]
MRANEVMLTIVLGALGVYFSVLNGRGLLRYAHFRRLRRTAVLTWPVGNPRSYSLQLALGVVSGGVAVLNGYLDRPIHHVFSQSVMALYFVLIVPLSGRIHLGLYRDGVWADMGFLPWARIGRMAFRETPNIVLYLLPRGGSRPFRLPVPAEEYGAVRKLLEEKKREGAVRTQEHILGL